MNKTNFNPTYFRKILNIFEMGNDYKSGAKKYWSVHKWYERQRKKIINYYKQHNLNVKQENYECILYYFLANVSVTCNQQPKQKQVGTMQRPSHQMRSLFFYAFLSPILKLHKN